MTLFAADYPLFAIASLKDGCLLVAGGGGASKTGVPNRVVGANISRAKVDEKKRPRHRKSIEFRAESATSIRTALAYARTTSAVDR